MTNICNASFIIKRGCLKKPLECQVELVGTSLLCIELHFDMLNVTNVNKF